MKEKIYEALMALASKLGTTADKLWVILVKQNEVIIFRYHIALWILGICLALFIIGLILCVKSGLETDGAGTVGVALLVPSAVVGLFDIIYLVAELGAYTTALKNPEYNSVSRILSAISGWN